MEAKRRSRTMSTDEFGMLLDRYIDNLRIIWNDKKKRHGTLKIIRDLIDEYLKSNND